MKKKLILAIILAVAILTRLPMLDKFPIGLNSDEAAIGYNAYSLIETGKDEHGMSWPLVFRSFDDYKPPLYFYLVLPFIKVMGLSVWAVRLPSAILGVLTVYVLYLLLKELLSEKEKSPNKEYLPLLSAFILAVSPWHIHFSRGGWEVNASTFMILLGVYAFIKGLKKPRFYFLFVISMVLSLYTYHSARIIAPLISLSLLILFFKQIKNFKVFILAAVLGVMLSLPIGFQMLSQEGQSRFSGVSIFADPGPLAWVHEMRRVDKNPDSLLTKIKYNRYTAYTGKYISNYFLHFSPKFLFISGDVIDRSRIPGFGQSFLVFLPFFFLGIFSYVFASENTKKVFLPWLFIAPVAAALTYQSPHALRSENLVIPLSVTIALGLIFLFTFLRRTKTFTYILASTLFVILCIQFVNYLKSYYITYPKEIPIAWQYGFKEISEYLAPKYGNVNKIIVSTRYDQPYILLAFFSKYSPQSFQKELVMSERDNFGFSTGIGFGKYEFRRIDFEKDSKLPNTILVSVPEETPKGIVPDKVIEYTQGVPVFNIFLSKQ